MQMKSSPVSLWGPGSCRSSIDGLKILYIIFLTLVILCNPQVLDQLLRNPFGLIFMRLLLPLPENPKPLFILRAEGEGELFLLPHLLSWDIKASQFAPPSLILPSSLPPVFCKFPCILLRSYPVSVVSRWNFALKALAGRQSSSGSAFPCNCESHTAGQVTV